MKKLMEHTLHERIAAIIEPSLVDMGYVIVQIRLVEGGRRTLQIMAERTDQKNMTVEDCAMISNRVSVLLDVEDPIQGAYMLEVSSPGIDRPLIKREDFTRYKGFEAKLETRLPIAGRRRFKGRLKGFESEDVIIEFDGNETRIPFDMVQSAKLLLTDELINWHGQQADAATNA